jgi:fatty acid CoA ligase FadD9
MQILVVGGAAVSPFTKEFMGKCFNLPVFDGYGTTEAGGITADGKLYPGTEVKIVDCPDLGYTANDKPWPRGEVWARTLSMVSGYYKDPETTNEYFKDGWFITGDIVEVRNGNEFYIIDRRKNLFKLSQGVFVAPSSIENKLLVSDFVHQIYVYGDHTRSHLVAVVVPNLTNLSRWAVENGFLNPIDFVSQKGIDIKSLLPEATPETSGKMVVSENLLQAHFDAYAAHICSLPASKAKVLKELHGTALKIQLPSYHTPAAVTLESEKWTAENKLVTPSDKPQRAALEKKYLDSISRMYAEIAESHDETAAFSDQIRDVVKEVTGVESGNQDGTEDLSSSFATDSLTVLKLIHTLNKQFNTNLSFVDIMRETGGRLTPDLIASVLSKHASKSKHQNGVLDPWSMQDARILSDLDTIVPVDDVLLGSFYATAKPTDKLQKVLVTGATGFLGFHLVCELLDTHPDTTFVLLIRASSEEEAKSRFFDTTATRQRAIFNDSERSRLEIIPGDFARPDLGVSPETYSTLTQEIDAIYHVGAAVNWIWGYDSVRDANVLGTIHLLVLATTHKLKYFYFVSSASTTIGVAVVPAEPSSPLMVDWNSKGPLEETSTMGKADIVHRSAYVISKWVAETIVKRSIQLGLPGCILRPGMITGHSKSGACHPTDFSPRLLIGLAQSRAGFTSDQPLEWMPVDFCAKAVVGLTMHFRDSILPVLYEAKALGVVPSFNIQNYSTATYNAIMMYMRSASINVQQMIYPVWRQKIVADQNSPLWPLLPFFGEHSCSMYAQLMPAPQTYSILQSLGITCPPADEALFHTYIRYLKEEKLI